MIRNIGNAISYSNAQLIGYHYFDKVTNMIKPIILSMLSISSMMLVSCGTPKLESQRYQQDAPLTIQPVGGCVWTDTPEDVLAGYEWVGEVSDDLDDIEAEVPLFLHCRIP
jgi:hypothetical protein